jgi:hypothetical protein
MKLEDHLNEDPVIPDQKFCGISFLRDVRGEKSEVDDLMNVDKSNIKLSSVMGFKVKFVTSTYEEAQKKTEQLREMDPRFDIFIGEIGKWLPFDPTPKQVENYEYAESELNNIMKSYDQNQEKVKIYEEKRRVMGQMDNTDTNIKRKEKSKKKMLKDMKKHKTDYSDLIKKIDVDIKKLENEQKSLKQTDSKFEEKIKDMNKDMGLNYKEPRNVDKDTSNNESL